MGRLPEGKARTEKVFARVTPEGHAVFTETRERLNMSESDALREGMALFVAKHQEKKR